MNDPLAIIPAVRDQLQRLLHRSDVQSIRIDKGSPLAVGVKAAGHPVRWFYGASLFSALARAEETYGIRAPAAKEGE